MYRILVVEDDQEINQMEYRLLTRNQYQVQCAFSGTEALLLMEKETFDLVILDLMLPGIEGGQLVDHIHKQADIPILCVSAIDELETRLKLLRDGADDYLVKPFNNDELLVKIEVLLRRVQKKQGKEEKLEWKEITIEEESRKVLVGEKELELTGKEYDILVLLMTNPQKVFTKENIFESVWGEDYLGDESAVQMHVSNLRNKLSSKKDEYIKTVWGIGYKMQEV